jgi:hypothetical protein
MSWNNIIPGWLLQRMLMHKQEQEEEIRERRKRELESYWQYPTHRGCNSGLENLEDDEDLW